MAFVIAIIAAIVLPSSVRADIEDMTIETGCDTLPSYNGKIGLPSGDYDVYVRLARRGEQAVVKGYVQLPGQLGDCHLLGGTEVQASGDRWTKLGQFSAFASQEYILQASSAALDALPTANRPAFLVVPQDNPVCVPDIECIVSLQGQTGYLRPAGTPLNQSSLHVMRAQPLDTDDITSVAYFVDNTLTYTTSNLEDFDMRYVPYAGQSLTRVVEYNNGQHIIIDSTSPDDHVDAMSSFLFRLTNARPVTVKIALVTGSIVVLFLLCTIVTRIVRRYRYERYRRGFLKLASHIAPPEHQTAIHRRDVALNVLRKIRTVGLTLGAAVLVILLLDTYVMKLYTVDGASMQPILHSGDKMLVNQLPATIARMNRREYVPKRGDIVVTQARFGIQDQSDSAQTNSTTYIVKRVLGLPGERVVVQDGRTYIYNAQHPEGFDVDEKSAWSASYTPGSTVEQLDIQLGESELFIAGDNRDESIDSRLNGPIRTHEIVGPAWRVWGA